MLLAERMKLAGDPGDCRGNGVLHFEDVACEHSQSVEMSLRKRGFN